MSSVVPAALVAAGLAVAVPNGSASAQGLLDFLFGNIRRPAPTQPPVVYMPHRIAPVPLNAQERVNFGSGGPGGPRMAYCVRLCDGRHFPIQSHRNASTAAQCRAFCPGSATRIFAGSGIEHAVSADGRRYADLPNAFVYRKRFVPGCTCDGRSPAGIAQQPVADDPTLRPGDIVATNSGLTIYQGKDSHRQAVLTPIDEARISKSLRDRLADVKVVPEPVVAETEPEQPPPDHTSVTPDDLRRQISARDITARVP
jgi:hypothetical protein